MFQFTAMAFAVVFVLGEIVFTLLPVVQHLFNDVFTLILESENERK
jgi:hypothetical protein